MTFTFRGLARPFLLALVLVASVSGCATSSTPGDPLEHFNRAMFNFNDKIDQVALKPTASFYQRVTPTVIQTGISNFFGNLGDVWTAINNLLQGKGADGMSDVMRVALNSTFGLGGILDIASEAGLAKHNEDFGQTLGTWGVKGGPYVVLPGFGSYTLRDAIVLPLDWLADPWGYKKPVYVRNTGIAVRLVDQRASVLEASRMIEEAALDKYEFIRDAYLQRRESKINDGRDNRDNPPQTQVQPQLQDQAAAKLDGEQPPADKAPEVDKADKAGAAQAATAPAPEPAKATEAGKTPAADADSTPAPDKTAAPAVDSAEPAKALPAADAKK